MAPSLVDQPTTNGQHVQQTADGYVIPDTLVGVRRPIKVIVIGFGFSGINLSYILGKETKNSNITLQFYEKNAELGGTWFENTYPGCSCDIPAVNYQFTWHPSPDWKSYYAKSEETLAYLQSVVAHHELDTCVKYNHRLTGAWWDHQKGQWKVRIEPNGDSSAAFYDYSEILISATGVLNNPKWPELKGLESFKNKVHTAAWDHSIELTGKTVGVIGNGSSSIQVVPAIYDRVDRIVNFMRSPTWVTAGYASNLAGGADGGNVAYTEEERRRFVEDPEGYLAYRKAVEKEMNSNFGMLIKDTPAQIAAYEYATSEMRRKLSKRPDLAEKLIPKTFAVGCRRPNPGHGYLEAISSEKCDVTFSGIAEVTPEGIVTEDGVKHELDVLVCGTGFDVSFRPSFPVVGRDGLDMRDAFKDVPDSYLSTMTPGFPNYFMMLGPFAPYGHGSIIPAVEVIARNISMTLEKFQTQNVKSVEPKREAVAEFREHRDLYMKKTVWNAPCNSWFKLGPKGETVLMWPGSRLHFIDIMLHPRWEDYDWEYLMGNRFSYWGNGFTMADADVEGTDKAWYIAGV
ncbi:hypothetical protein GGS20DRAFT_533207 [Poronia punctata]|nr:hypothetical protein GGS20DRAFT_533207 [Poronia punctata]